MIEIKNVTFHYSGLDQAGLCDFNLSVTDGECILLCGASGCGKTTVTRLINGLIPHFFKGELTGDVYVNGLDIIKSRRVLMAQTANIEFANLFGVHRGSPVLYVENVVMDQNDRPIDLSKEYLDGVTQKFEFEVVNQ